MAAAVVLTVLAKVGPVEAAPIVFSAAGPNAVAIQGQVEAFRAALGTLNLNNPGSAGSGRREINWDGVPDAFAAPNAFPADFFNANSAGRARGVVYTTPGTSFQVSASPTNPTSTPIEFGNINPTYSGLFAFFSAPKLFTAIGSTVFDVDFFVPGTTTPALTRGFGAVFTDVDLANTTGLAFFDASSALLGTFFVPAISGNETLSFLGIDFGDAVISRVRVVSGKAALGPNEVGLIDLVVSDDFIYGEPIAAAAVPEPGTLFLFGSAITALAALRRPPRRWRRAA